MSDTLDDAPSFDAQLYAEGRPPAPGGPFDTESPSQREAADRKRRTALDQRIETAQAMLSTKAGRDFLAWLLFDLAGFTASTVSGANTAEGLQTAGLFYAGRRDVALHLHQMLRTADKSGYVVLLSEHVDKM